MRAAAATTALMGACLLAGHALADTIPIPPVTTVTVPTLTVPTVTAPTLLAICLLLAAWILAVVVYDGESTWEEGAILVGFYVVVAASFWWGV